MNTIEELKQSIEEYASYFKGQGLFYEEVSKIVDNLRITIRYHYIRSAGIIVLKKVEDVEEGFIFRTKRTKTLGREVIDTSKLDNKEVLQSVLSLFGEDFINDPIKMSSLLTVIRLLQVEMKEKIEHHKELRKTFDKSLDTAK